MSPTPSSWSRPGSAAYTAATTPQNSTADQHPAFVAHPTTAAEVADAVRAAAEQGLRVVPQSTGHGAGGALGDDVVLVDTSGLDHVHVDPSARLADVGAGSTWGRVNAEAERHGLLAPSGSAPSVGVCGYTFGGGVGWLVRQHGMASAALRRVEYVTGDGSIRVAAEDAPDPLDRDALWAFRGGGGVGIATRLQVELFPVTDLTAGYFLWPTAVLPEVVEAWAAALAGSPDVATSISVLRLPDVPAFPEALRGRPAVHLAIASPTGPIAAQQLIGAVRSAAEPAVSVWGPADAAALGRIHLDPPSAVPALGRARWTTAGTPALAAQVLGLATRQDSRFALVEIRAVGAPAAATAGAMVDTVGDFIVHAVAPAVGPDPVPGPDHVFDELLTTIALVDTGRSVGSWTEGATTVPDGLSAATRRRVREIADQVDPHHVLARSRHVS